MLNSFCSGDDDDDDDERCNETETLRGGVELEWEVERFIEGNSLAVVVVASVEEKEEGCPSRVL